MTHGSLLLKSDDGRMLLHASHTGSSRDICRDILRLPLRILQSGRDEQGFFHFYSLLASRPSESYAALVDTWESLLPLMRGWDLSALASLMTWSSPTKWAPVVPGSGQDLIEFASDWVVSIKGERLCYLTIHVPADEMSTMEQEVKNLRDKHFWLTPPWQIQGNTVSFFFEDIILQGLWHDTHPNSEPVPSLEAFFLAEQF